MATHDNIAREQRRGAPKGRGRVSLAKEGAAHEMARPFEDHAEARDRRHCTVMVTCWLAKLHNVAETLVDRPDVPASTVPTPSVPMDEIIAVLEMVQVTSEVTSCCVLLPENVAIAVKCTSLFAGGLVGTAVTDIAVTSGQTLTVVELFRVPSVAVMVVVTGGLVTFCAAVSSPVLRPMVATEVSDEFQRDWPVMSFGGPLSKVPVATICRVLPGGTVWPVGPMVILVSVGFTKNPRHPAPTANPISTMKASVNGSLRPVNITNRLE